VAEGLRFHVAVHSVAARMFAVIDAYDAMTSDRPYRKARPHRYALEEIRRNVGSQFDPETVAAFLSAQREEAHV
jgi:HD-GYP domain-containing protein (c-di-GMP phosphodiesterase class II)